MATYTNVSYAVKNVSTSGSAVTTVSSGTLAVSSLILSNTSSSPITVSVYINRSSINNYLVYQATVPVGGSLEAIQGIRVTLLTSDALYVLASAANSCDSVVSALSVV